MADVPGTAEDRLPSAAGLRLSKKSIDFSDSLTNVSIFGPLCGPKICRCAAQTPANAGFLQTFDSIRRGSRPLVLPLQKRTSFLQTGDFRQAETRAGRMSGPRSRLSKKSIDFSDSLPNVSIFGPRSGPKICRCAAQTPANAGFLQAFHPTRRGTCPLVLPRIISVFCFMREFSIGRMDLQKNLQVHSNRKSAVRKGKSMVSRDI